MVLNCFSVELLDCGSVIARRPQDISIIAKVVADEAISFRLWFLYNGNAAGRVRIVCEFLTSGTSLPMTVTDAAISLSMPFNNCGIAAERLKTRLTITFM